MWQCHFPVCLFSVFVKTEANKRLNKRFPRPFQFNPIITLLLPSGNQWDKLAAICVLKIVHHYSE